MERPASLTAAEAQVEFLRMSLARAQARNIIEIGTNKGMFGLLLANTLFSCSFKLLTFGDEQYSEACIHALASTYPHGIFEFVLGNSEVTVPVRLANDPIRFDFAWVDGGHEVDVAHSDLVNMMRIDCPFIAVDDWQYESVKAAIACALSEFPHYKLEAHHPWWEHDPCGAVLLTNRLTP